MSATPTITSNTPKEPKTGLTSEIVCQDDGWPGSVLEPGFHTRINAAIERFLAFDGRETVVVAFSGDTAVRALNAQFRGQDKPTNVLSFPANTSAVPGDTGEDGSTETTAFLGDIILARETVAREAGEQHLSFEHHTTHLIVHGILHLLGYDHQDDSSAEEMEALEIDILADLGIENPYTEELDDAR